MRTMGIGLLALVVFLLVPPVFADGVTAAFTFASAGGRDVDFTDASTPPGSITGWFWEFGDGHTSTLQSPSHTFPMNGTYFVCLVVTDGVASDTTCAPVGVFAELTAGFTYSSAGGLAVDFTDASTPSEDIAGWFWDFGDGYTSTTQNPTHTFPMCGFFFVCLIVTDGVASDTTCSVVEILDAITAGFRFAGAGGLTVDFTDTSVSVIGITDWLWDFGDGYTSTLQNPTHTFPMIGTYLTCLIATDACLSDTICLEVPLVATAVDQETEPGTESMLFMSKPNPAPEGTSLIFDLPSTAKVDLAIYDARGRLVSKLVSASLPAGRHSLPWDRRWASGIDAAAGMYYAVLRVGDETRTRKIVLVR